MKTPFKIFWIMACLGVLIGATHLFLPRPTPRTVVPGGNDADTARQNAVDSIDKVISDANGRRHLIEDYQRRKSSPAATRDAHSEAAESERAGAGQAHP